MKPPRTTATAGPRAGQIDSLPARKPAAAPGRNRSVSLMQFETRVESIHNMLERLAKESRKPLDFQACDLESVNESVNCRVLMGAHDLVAMLAAELQDALERFRQEYHARKT